jgi:hypothetical protein
MPVYKNFSKKSRKRREGAFDDFDSPESNITVNEENINRESWRKFLAYYRYYIDEFAVDVLGLHLSISFSAVDIEGYGSKPVLQLES